MKRNGVPSLVTADAWREQLAEIDRLKSEVAERAFARLVEIEAERDQILGTFPQLRKRLREQGATNGANGHGRVGETEILYDASGTTEPAHDKPRRGRPPGSGKRPRRVHDDAFKDAAVARVKSGEYSIDVAKAIDVARSVLDGWCKTRGVRPRVLSPEEHTRRKEAQTAPALTHAEARRRQIDADVTIPTLRFIAKHGKADTGMLIKKFEITRNGVDYRIREFTKRGLVRRPGAGLVELTEQGAALLARPIDEKKRKQ